VAGWCVWSFLVWHGAAAADEKPRQRVYDNRLTRIANPKPLLADHPEFVEPVREVGRFEAPILVNDMGGNLHVRAWRFSYNARGIIEVPNLLRADRTAVIVVHPWGVDDGQGWRTPEPAGAADFCTPAKNKLAGKHTRKVINPFLKALRGKAALVMYSLPGSEDSIRKKLYRSIRGKPSAKDRARGARELTAKLKGFSYKGQPLPARLTLSEDKPVVDYFRQFRGLDAGPKFNNAGFWDLPIPVTRDLDVDPDDVVIYDADGYPALRDFLKKQKIRHILLAGYATDMCFCRTTAGYQNLSKDFNVFLVGDATLATFPANASPRFATNAAVSFAALDQLVTQVSWVKYEAPRESRRGSGRVQAVRSLGRFLALLRSRLRQNAGLGRQGHRFGIQKPKALERQARRGQRAVYVLPPFPMTTLLFQNGTVVLPDRLLANGEVVVHGAHIRAVRPGEAKAVPGPAVIDLEGGYLAPGFIDLHVHGGAGADFMDGTTDAFRTACRAHLRHGTTGLLPTTTVARHEQHLAFLDTCRRLMRDGSGGARILGAHLYGPYFALEAKGCHPGAPVRPPRPDEFEQYLGYADAIATATVAPELPGAEAFVRACRARGVRCNAGHSHATFDQVEAALGWGVRHVDHLFCAMSDRARLRQIQTYPMRGGLMEATLYFDELTTEVIADGKHLRRELLLLAYKVKGPDRLALVTDSSRALDMPDGGYLFGPLDGGEPIVRQGGVGVMPDGRALASGVMGMDHAVRTFHRLTGVPLPEVVRMASLTPARIIGRDQEVGSVEPGKRADLLLLTTDLHVRQVFLGGEPVDMG
jgi:N-acetylglucosamine-6-phosphate deacetylase